MLVCNLYERVISKFISKVSDIYRIRYLSEIDIVTVATMYYKYFRNRPGHYKIHYAYKTKQPYKLKFCH